MNDLRLLNFVSHSDFRVSRASVSEDMRNRIVLASDELTIAFPEKGWKAEVHIYRDYGWASFDIRKSDTEIALLCAMTWTPQGSKEGQFALQQAVQRLYPHIGKPVWRKTLVREPWLGVVILPFWATALKAEANLHLWATELERAIAFSLLDSISTTATGG